MRTSNEKEYQRLEILRMKRQLKWFWPGKILEGVIAGLVFAGALWIIPDNYFKFLKESIDQKETALLQKEVEVESLKNQFKVDKSRLEKERKELALKIQQQEDESTLQKKEYENSKKELTDRERDIVKLNESIKKGSVNARKVAEAQQEKSNILKRYSELRNKLQAKITVHEKEVSKYEERLISIQNELGLLRAKSIKDTVVLSIAQRILADGNFYDGTVYLSGGIDDKKLASLRKSVGSSNEPVYALIDTTLSGSAVDGFLFSDCQLFYSDGKAKGKVLYREAFNEVPIVEDGKTRLSIDGLEVDVLSGDLTARKIIGAIRDIKDHIDQACEPAGS